MSMQELIDEKHYLEQLINTLLDKSNEEEMDIKLHGYPANWLDSPNQGNSERTQVSTSRLKHLLRSLTMSFPIMEMEGAQIKTFDSLLNKERTIIAEFGMKKATVPTKKLKSLVYSHAEKGRITSDNTKQQFHITIPFTALLPYLLVEPK